MAADPAQHFCGTAAKLSAALGAPPLFAPFAGREPQGARSTQPARPRSGVGRQDVEPLRRRAMAGRFTRFGRDDAPPADNRGAVATDERTYADGTDTDTNQRTSV